LPPFMYAAAPMTLPATDISTPARPPLFTPAAASSAPAPIAAQRRISWSFMRVYVAGSAPLRGRGRGRGSGRGAG
jgi:hypothetical protein